MTHSSDSEHKTSLSPVRRHDSIPRFYGPSSAPEPANFTALLSRGVKVPVRVIDAVLFFC